MQAMALTGLRQMAMRDVPNPQIQKPTDVLLRVGVVGVCGSDVHYYRTGRIGSQAVDYPYSVGHEFAGVVEAVGTDVVRVKPGDRVAVDPAMSCGQCDQCLAGRYHTCRELRFLGCPGQAEGCLLELIVMPEACCYPIADGMTLEQGAIVEPLSIGWYAVKTSVALHDVKIGILGCGPIGASVLLSALAHGAGGIYVTDPIDARLELARKSGASWTGNPDRQDVVGEIIEQEPLLLDAVFECCGQQDALDQAVELLKPGGKLMVIGIPVVDRVSFDIDKLRRKEICVQNVRRQNDCMQEAIELIETARVNVDAMVTHRYPFEASADAFELGP